MTALSTAERQARLRGELAAEQLGSRGLERMARNPGCGVLKALTMASVSPATAATSVYGEADREGQSPFALGAGNQFEAALFGSGAARLIELYRTRARLSTAECRLVDVSALAPETSRSAMDRRRTLSERLLRSKLAGDSTAPNIIIKPRLVVVLLGLEFNIEPDVLVAADADAFYTAIEIKSYPDRDGKTDPVDVRGACRQAAVAVIGLRESARRLGVVDAEELAPARADLVLRVPGSFYPTLRPMRLDGEVDSLIRALATAPSDLAGAEALLAALDGDASLDDPRVLDRLPNSFRESCREFCALAAQCKRRATELGDPILLGSQAREEYAAAGSLGRVLELLEGLGAPPRTPAEQALQLRLQQCATELRLAISNRRANFTMTADLDLLTRLLAYQAGRASRRASHRQVSIHPEACWPPVASCLSRGLHTGPPSMVKYT